MNSQNTKAQKILKKIVARRKELGISQADLALKLNMSFNGYFKVEKSDTKLDTKRMFKIFEILNISGKDFFEDFK